MTTMEAHLGTVKELGQRLGSLVESNDCEVESHRFSFAEPSHLRQVSMQQKNHQVRRLPEDQEYHLVQSSEDL